MRAFVLLAALLLAGGAAAQDMRPLSSGEVTSGRINPEPSNGDLVLQYGSLSRVHFKFPFKGIRLGDPHTVRAEPQSDHIVSFTPLAPGRTNITFESPDGKTTNWGTITVVREPREVKVYTPKPAEKNAETVRGSNVTVINTGQNGSQAKDADEAEYKSLMCNTAGCVPVPKPEK